MRERPILFSGQMMRAILDGRKTQTRRIVKLPENARSVRYYAPPSGRSQEGWADPGVNYWTPDGTFDDEHKEILSNHIDPCPYGQPGDRLWVKEQHEFLMRYANVRCLYRADMSEKIVEAPYVPKVNRGRPSIHMPRWASRITLEVTGVRVERLQEISEQDAGAEGAPEEITKFGLTIKYPSKISAFLELWDDINFNRAPWASNPWVWVVKFKKIFIGNDEKMRMRVEKGLEG